MKEMNLPIVAILALAAGVASVEILTECPPYTTVYIPHESDCTKFYICSMGKKYEMSCNKMYFNPELQACDYPWNVTCQNSQKCPPGLVFDPDRLVCDYPKNDHSEKLKCYPGLNIPHESSCNAYYECSVDGKRQALRMCAVGSNYDYERRTCDVSWRAKCWRGKCIPGEYLFHENDCNKYYECQADGKKVILQRCGKGLFYDCDRKMCVPLETLRRCCIVYPPDLYRPEDELLEDVL